MALKKMYPSDMFLTAHSLLSTGINSGKHGETDPVIGLEKARVQESPKACTAVEKLPIAGTRAVTIM